jgi:hypothetical protein
VTFKKALLRGLIGIPIGIFISTTIGLIISLMIGELAVIPPVGASVNRLSAYVVQYIVSIGMGFAFAFGSAIFEVDNWSMAKQTTLHFLLTSVVFLPCAVLARWVEPKLLSILVYFLIFILVYIVIWIIQYLTWKDRIAKLNKRLLHK